MKNLKVFLEDRPGALAELGEVLGRAGVSLEGGGMFVMDGKGVANYLVDDGLAGREALEAAGLHVVGQDEVVIQKLNQDEPGQLGKLLRRMAQAGVNVLTQYSDHNHQLVLVVDDLQAARAVSDGWAELRSAAGTGTAAPRARKRAHHYEVHVAWTGNTGSGTSSYTSYAREHDISAPGKATVSGSSDPAFRGDKTRYNPEEMLVASASTCHMLSYLHLCSVNGVVVLAYEDRPTGEMEELVDGTGAFVRVDLHPLVTVDPKTDVKRAGALHEDAHHGCFIANSLKVPVLVHPVIRQEK